MNGDPEQVVAALDGAVGPEELAAAAVYRASGHVHRESGARVRRQLLALDAARYGRRELARSLAAVTAGGEPGGPGEAWGVRWATGTDLDSRLRYAVPAPAGVVAVAGVVAADRALAVVGCEDGTLAWWDVVTGGKAGAVTTGSMGAVRALATAVVDGRPVAVTGHSRGTVLVWDLAGGELVATHRGVDDSWVNALATGLVDGRPVVVSGGTDRMLRVWDLADRTGGGALLTVRTGSVHALALAVLEGRPVAVTGHDEGVVRRWDLLSGRELSAGGDHVEAPEGDREDHADDEDDEGDGGGYRRCVTMELNARTHLLATDPEAAVPLAVSATTFDSAVRDLATGEPVGEPGPAYVAAAAVTTLGSRPAAVVAFEGRGPVQVWDLSARTHLRLPLIGHQGAVRGVATAVAKGRHLALTGGEDRSVRVWDLDGDQRAGAWSTGHAGPVHAVTTAVVDGRPVVLSGGADARVRCWDLDGGEPGEPLAAGDTAVGLLAVGAVDGRPALLARDSVETVRIWDLATREPLHGRSTSEYTSPSITFFAVVEGRFVGVTWEGRVWDLVESRWVGERPKQSGAMALESLGGRSVLLTGRRTEAVRLWDVATGEPAGPSFAVPGGDVRAGAVGLLDGRPVVAAGGDDGTVRVWDAGTGRQIGGYAFPAGIRGLAVAPDGRLAVGFGADLAVLAHH
ncbi:WD40 repeat domain-containing protein [Kitasatospora sp. NPDC004745]|uniref:WD40 repeat domain-containing protein n=1 Tax=Kitasatospora sp. NPDC004745 TaxID=3364019 RepID=UPI003673ADAF